MDQDDLLNLQHNVGRHEDDLDKLSNGIADLKADIEIILRMTNMLQQVEHEVGIMEAPRSQGSGTPAPDAALLEKYRAFLYRHAID